MKKIMFYGLSAEREIEIALPLKEKFKAEIRMLDQSCLNKSLGSLFGGEDITVDDEEYGKVDKEFMMLKDFDNDDTKALLDFFKANSIQRPIACGLTKTNSSWSLGELFKQLSLEDEYMKRNQN